jgi:hypothetical protein
MKKNKVQVSDNLMNLVSETQSRITPRFNSIDVDNQQLSDI